MTDACFSLAAWVPYIIGAFFIGGISVGFSFRLVVDYAELTAYRAIARKQP